MIRVKGWPLGLLVALFILVQDGWGQVLATRDAGPRFGPEFTFTRLNSDEAWTLSDASNRVVRRMTQHLIEGQPEGAKFLFQGRNRFVSPNGWWFQVAQDPGVLEVQMSPLTASDFVRFASDIQDAVFVSHFNEGLYPAWYLGGGHINIDVGYFLDKPPVLLRNFLVDLLNHPELFMGVFNYDTCNAIPYNLSLDAWRFLVLRVRNFDQGDYGNPFRINKATIFGFLRNLGVTLTNLNDDLRTEWRPNLCRGKSYAVAFSDVGGPNGGRIEIRGVRPQRSIDVWVRQISLLRDRIHFLNEKMEGFLPLDPSFIVKPGSHLAPFLLNPPLPPQQVFRRFYSYVHASGHKWQDHRDYLWPNWILRDPNNPAQLTELEQFEQSSWYRVRETVRKCTALLKEKVG